MSKYEEKHKKQLVSVSKTRQKTHKRDGTESSETDERFTALRAGIRKETAEKHNGLPFTHRQITKDKTEYDRKKFKRYFNGGDER